MRSTTVRAVRTGVVVTALLLAPTGCASAPAVEPVAAAQSVAEAPAPFDAAAQIEAMKRLEFMVGRWEGSGYVVREGGVRSDFTITEVVQYKLDGLLIAVDGSGRDAADPSISTHSAFALATYDAASDTFRWEAFTEDGRLETELIVSENRWQWTLQPVPEVTIRYTSDFTDTEWREIGEISLDGGATWTTNLEMTLDRVA